MLIFFQRILFSSLLLFFVTCQCHATPSSTEIDLKNAYTQWCDSIATAKGNAKQIVKYYAPNAILLPTLSNDILFNTDGGLDAYFIKLTNKPNIKCTPEKLITNTYGNLGINSGYYEFSYTEKNKTIRVNACFTFVYEKKANQWLIVNHHSSKLLAE